MTGGSRTTLSITPTDPRCETAQQSRAGAPDIGTTQDRDDLERLPGGAFECKVVDVPAPTLLGVQELMVEEVETEIDRLAQFWPTFVRISNGTAVSEMTRMTTR